MFRSRSSAASLAGVLAAGCGGAQHPRACAPDVAIAIAAQDDVARYATCTRAARVTIRTGAPLDLAPLAALAVIDGDLVVGPTLQLDALNLPALRTAGSVQVHSNSSLRSVALPQLARAGRVTIAANAAATTVSLPRLVTVDGQVSLSEMGSLEIVDLGALESVGEDLVIADNPVLTTVDVGRLARVRALRVAGNRALGPLATALPGGPDGDHESMSRGQ